MSVNRTTAKYIEARDSLPEGLRSTFDQLVEEYHFHTIAHYGQGYVAYKVLASLVRDGWRPSDEPAGKQATDQN